MSKLSRYKAERRTARHIGGKRGQMILFHRTTISASTAIRQNGFRDGRGNYMTNRVFSGVWFSDQPLDSNEGASGDVLLRVTLSLSESELKDWEWCEEGKPYREWLVPSKIVNAALKLLEVVRD